ncbi:MAG: UDP-N-acetylglucosamine--N-acetylmuramyl-(pentapeptide) pyrophosphoryl-undecaprenol N-acetylglucosamine transferase [Epsilonproteobacteria bacterium]|nr:UDP-N-acetylglucosamine--N-acetylmuramyl-(pentapeptide) pyrophosphoryl-undecaprenol N-acetylglucosamine transferase [Campylobacterota bacterium]
MKNTHVQTCSAAGEHNHTKKSATICYVGGRSGGHIVPALTHAHNHLIKKPDDKILFIATNTPLDGALVGAATHVHKKLYLKLPNVPRRLLAMPAFTYRFGVAFVKSFNTLRRQRVARVVSMGGYVSLPVCLAARLLRIPVTLFELNAHPGKATKFLAPHVTEVAVCFEQAKKSFARSVTCVPYPLQYQAKPHEQELIDHKRLHGLEVGKKVLLVLGGSQGSIFLNGLIGRWLDAEPSAHDRVHVVHQTGANDSCDWAAWYHERGIAATVFPYSNDLALWYSCADLVVCRAGAGTLFEVAFFQKPCVIIPLVTAETAHQVDNAKAMVAHYPGQFAMFNQADIQGNPELFCERMAHELQR